MNVEANLLKSNMLAAQAPQNVLQAIRQASMSTGVDFSYLVEKAAAESSFNPSAKAKTSSAAGLYQFIESTWMQMVKTHGAKYGLGEYADQIKNGKVADKAMRKEILNLRNDPEIASFMAAELASENRAYLQRHVRGTIGPTEMYFAHFMGAGGATGFLKALKESPLAIAADLFPREAMANRGVFYDRNTGRAKSLQEVYAFFDKKFSSGPAETPAAPELRVKPAANDTPAVAQVRKGGVPFIAHTDYDQTSPLQQLMAMDLMDSLPRIALREERIFPASLYGAIALSPTDLALLFTDSE